MSDKQMVSVPRGTVENAAELLQEYNKCSIARDLRALLAQPADQHQGEPVGEVVAFGKGLHEIAWAAGRMPKLGAKLYTSADPAEVERLREKADHLTEANRLLMDDCDTLRAQLSAWQALAAERLEVATGLRAQVSQHKLAMDAACAEIAERDALLARVVNSGALSSEQYESLEADYCALSASAEPSAPGDGVRDERDYAIEHAGYLADAADQVLADYQAYSLAQMLENEGGDDGDGEHAEAVDSARDELHDGLANLRSMTYELRKRRPRNKPTTL